MGVTFSVPETHIRPFMLSLVPSILIVTIQGGQDGYLAQLYCIYQTRTSTMSCKFDFMIIRNSWHHIRVSVYLTT